MLLAGCATAPIPEPGATLVWGYVRLVPKAGSEALGGGYGDRRLAQVKRVDYSHPRFAVVFARTQADARERSVEIAIREAPRGLHLEPPFASTTPGAGLEITNATTSEQIVSLPEAGRLHRLDPGESVAITGLALGEASVHLLGLPDSDAFEPTRVWVTEGITVEVEQSGRYVLRGLAPGPHRLGAWHPRLPPSPEHEIFLEPDQAARLDIEIGVDAGKPPRGDER